MGLRYSARIPENGKSAFCFAITAWKTTSKAAELIKGGRSIGQPAYARNPRVLFLGILEGGLEVAPEGVRILEAGAQAQEARWHAIALPAMPALHDARHSAERGGVDDQARRRLDPPGGVAVRDVEREETADPRIAHDLHLGMASQPLGECGCRLGLAAYADLERLQPAQQEPGRVGRSHDPGTG